MRRMIRLEGNRPYKEQAEEVHRSVNGWASAVVKATKAKIDIKGIENIPTEGPVLFVSNHQSDVDIMLFLSLVKLPIGFIAKIEMLKVPFIRTWMKLMRSVFIDRKNIRQTAGVIIEGIEILKSGHSMVVFPEGTRSRSGEPLPFKPGAIKLATKSMADIVPVTINGSSNVLENNRYRVKAADVKIIFHPVIRTKDLDTAELAKLSETVENIILGGLGK